MTQRIKLPLLQGIGEAINRPAFFFLDKYNPRSWILPLSSFLLQIVLIYNWKNLGSDFSQNFDLGGAHGHTFIKKKKKKKSKNSQRSHKQEHTIRQIGSSVITIIIIIIIIIIILWKIPKDLTFYGVYSIKIAICRQWVSFFCKCLIQQMGKLEPIILWEKSIKFTKSKLCGIN